MDADQSQIDIYLATIYSETRNMAPISGGFANKAQNFEVVAQYQFDFGLRPSLGYHWHHISNRLPSLLLFYLRRVPEGFDR